MKIMTRVSLGAGWNYRLEQFGVGREEGRTHELYFGLGVKNAPP